MATIRLLDTQYFDGPSVWFQQPVLIATLGLDSESLNLSADQRSHFDQSLIHLAAATPAFALADTGVSFAAVEETLPNTIAALSTHLLNLAGMQSAWSASWPGPNADSHQIAFACQQRRAGELALKIALRLIDSAMTASAPADDLEKDMQRLQAFAGNNPTRSILHETKRRNIPVARIDPAGVTLELGSGRYRQRSRGSRTWRTPGLGSEITRNKERAGAYLRAAGLPAPAGTVVASATQAVRAAAAIGYPVVVKPIDQAGSVGLYLERRNEEEVAAAFAKAAAVAPGTRVLVERFVTGKTFRASVVGGRVLSIVEQQPASVEGDGEHTVRNLIDFANARLAERPAGGMPLRPMLIDDAAADALGRQGLTLDSVPDNGQLVRVSPTPGGRDGFMRNYAIDRTNEAHPHNVNLILQAMQLLGLDTATFDVVTPDISEPVTAENGAIVDINVGSGFSNELDPSLGVSYELGPAILDMLFPPGQPVRAPIIAVMGDKVQGHVIATDLASRLQDAGYSIGLDAHDGLTLAGTFLRGADHRGPAGVRTLLNNPATEIVVAEIDADELVAEGLGFDYCDVAIITGLCGQLTPFGKPVEAVLTGLLDPSGTLIEASDVPLADLLHGNATQQPAVVPVAKVGAELVESVTATVMQAVGRPPGPQPAVLIPSPSPNAARRESPVGN